METELGRPAGAVGEMAHGTGAMKEEKVAATEFRVSV